MALSIFIPLLFILFFFPPSNAQSFIGVNYGLLADNLPAPSETAKLLQSTSIQKVRLYNADPSIIKSLAGTGIGIVIGVANGDLPSIASDLNVASQWISSNVLPFYPASNIILINVGNELLLSNDLNLVNQLLPAMQNIQKALEAVSLGGKIKVSTVHAMTVLGNSEPPSAGSFALSYQAGLKVILQFLSDTGSPFAINPYPFFAYQSDPRPETLAFCLFQPNAGRVDSNTGIKYMNMFDAQTSQSPPLGEATSMGWCVPKDDATEEQLQDSLDWVCGQGIDCGPIMPGGVCFEPNNLMSHTAYAMNLYFQKSPENPTDCDFSKTARITSDNPSYNSCVYPRAGDGSIRGEMNKYVTSDKATETNGSESSSSLYLPLVIMFVSFFFLFPSLRIM